MQCLGPLNCPIKLGGSSARPDKLYVLSKFCIEQLSNLWVVYVPPAILFPPEFPHFSSSISPKKFSIQIRPSNGCCCDMVVPSFLFCQHTKAQFHIRRTVGSDFLPRLFRCAGGGSRGLQRV